MEKIKLSLITPILLLISMSIILMACPGSKNDPEPLPSQDYKELTNSEKGILGTWYYYSHSYSEYRCITFNNDRTACYYEISSLSSSATKGNKKCYSDWFVDEEVTEGSTFDVNILGDYTGGVHWAGYTINTDDWILRKDGSTEMTEFSKIECDFCN